MEEEVLIVYVVGTVSGDEVANKLQAGELAASVNAKTYHGFGLRFAEDVGQRPKLRNIQDITRPTAYICSLSCATPRTRSAIVRRLRYVNNLSFPLTDIRCSRFLVEGHWWGIETQMLQ